jgi:hypothetical protein
MPTEKPRLYKESGAFFDSDGERFRLAGNHQKR